MGDEILKHFDGGRYLPKITQKRDPEQPKTIDSENYPEKDQKNVVVEDDLVKRGLTTYIRNTDQPFIGTATRYYEDGSKRTETPYANGKKHGVSIGFHREGYKWSETPYVEGKIHGTVISYRKDGSKQKETPYVKSKQHGTLITFRDDGSKNSEYPYLNGKLHGTAKMYRSDGSKYQEEVYSKGKKISAKGLGSSPKTSSPTKMSPRREAMATLLPGNTSIPLTSITSPSGNGIVVMG